MEKQSTLKERQMEATTDDERTIARLLIDQVEFADTLLINKCDLISANLLSRTRQFLVNLNPTAKVLQTVHADVELAEILDTGRFHIEKARAFVGFDTELINPHVSETEEYGIAIIVFSSKLPFHPTRLHRLFFGESNGGPLDESQVSEQSPLKSIYRSKGFFYLASHLDSKLTWSTAGMVAGFEMMEPWLASMLPEHLWPSDDDWHPQFGDREQKLVLIGSASQLQGIRTTLQSCLLTNAEIASGPSVWQEMDQGHHWQLDESDPEADDAASNVTQ